jgi:hypothetical protein
MSSHKGALEVSIVEFFPGAWLLLVVAKLVYILESRRTEGSSGDYIGGHRPRQLCWKSSDRLFDNKPRENEKPEMTF